MDQTQIEYAAALIGRIDSGEKSIFLDSVNTETQVEARLFPEGIFYSCTAYKKGLRIHIAFEMDTDAYNEEVAALVRGSLKKTGKTSCVLWIWNDNRKIIEHLKEAFHVTKKGSHYYASIEFIMRRENFRPVPNETLEVRPYEKKRLFAYLDMLDHSMTFASPPPSYRRDFFRHRKRFAELENDARFYFEAFWKDSELVGLYWLKNAEIDTLAVAAGQQRRGYGSIILTRAIEMALKRTDADFAYLYAVDWNVKGQSFYKKYGMEQSGHSYCLHVENYSE